MKGVEKMMPTIENPNIHLSFSLDDFFRCGNCKKFSGCSAEGARATDYICSDFEPANAIMQKFEGNKNCCWVIIMRVSKNKIWVPCEKYEEEAQRLRNEIALFVLQHWDKVKRDALIDFKDLSLEPRLRQLSMPFIYHISNLERWRLRI